MRLNLNRRSVLSGLIALPACQGSGSKFDAQVIIVGAGLAGLRAAQLLSAQGKDVLVLEGGEHIGGRLKTYDYGALGRIEASPDSIGASDKRLLALTREMGLALTSKDTTPPRTAYFYDGNIFSPDAWTALDTGLFPPPFTGAGPTAPLLSLAAVANPLQIDTDWQDPRFAAYDISAQDFLLEAGFQGDAQKLIGQAFDANSLRNYSMMNLYRKLQLRSDASAQTIKDGWQSLPEAIAKTLPRKILTNQIVSHIAIEPDKAIITTASGKSFTAEHCLCALPFGALRNIAIKAFMPAAQSDAIRDMPQLQEFNIHVKTDTPFWDADSLPADMWTDLPLERVQAVRDTNGTPTGLFNIIINGRNATRSLWDDRSQIEARLKAYLKTVRPASGGDFELLTVQDWTRNNPLMGGAESYWSPGQIAKWAGEMGKPSPQLVFAGQDFSAAQIGLEGALDSAETAVNYLLELSAN